MQEHFAAYPAGNSMAYTPAPQEDMAPIQQENN
jgi:hypothetical protein